MLMQSGRLLLLHQVSAPAVAPAPAVDVDVAVDVGGDSSNVAVGYTHEF